MQDLLWDDDFSVRCLLPTFGTILRRIACNAVSFWRGYQSNAKIRFQSLFMLITFHFLDLASSYSA